ncbi:MAG: peptide ABC transporter substrate-binding protein, partial [Puniceicoccaceae bacterium]
MARSFLRRLSAVLPALPALLLLSACGPRESVVERGLREGVLHVAISAEPRALDPHTATGIGEAQVLAAVFEGLVIDHPETDGAIAPGAAHSWEVSADGLAYTFHLRPDARWSNGDPLTADHFRYAFHRILHPDLGSSYAEMLYPLSHAESFHRGETDDFARVGVAAPDDHTLVLTLASPLPHFLQLLRHFAWYPVHPPTIKAHDAFSRRGTPWTRPA